MVRGLSNLLGSKHMMSIIKKLGSGQPMILTHAHLYLKVMPVCPSYSILLFLSSSLVFLVHQFPGRDLGPLL